MPTVQRYGQRQVRTLALPGARRTAAETALSQGAGVEEARGAKFETIGRVGAGVAQLGATVYADLREKAQARANDVARLSWKNRLSQWETDTVYNTETGVMATRGAAANELPERVMGEFETLVSEIEAGLTSEAQRLAFAQDVTSVRSQVYNTVQSHVSQEITKLEANELTAFVENQRSYAVSNANNPRIVGQSLAEITAAIRKHGQNVGMGAEQIEAAITAQRSAVHSQVIDRFLTAGNQQAAQVYFEETKSEISGESVAKIEKALTVGRVRQEGQKKSDEILLAGGTLAEQRAKAREIEDPEVRDDVMSRLEHEHNIKERADAEALEIRLRGVYDVLDKTPNVNRIPPSIWSEMTGAQRTAAMEYARRKAVGEPIETNYRRFYELMQMAGDNPAEFAKLNLWGDRARLGDGEFKQLAGLQLSIKGGDSRAGQQQLASFTTKSQLLSDALTQYGIDPDPDPGTPEATAQAELRRLIDRQLEALGPGAEPSNSDIRSVIDQIMTTEATKAAPSPFWSVMTSGLPTGTGLAVLGSVAPSTGILGLFRSTERRLLIEGTIADVPAGERQQIEAALGRAGMPVSDATILEAWKVKKVRDANAQRLQNRGR
jgi:hypothetical protein